MLNTVCIEYSGLVPMSPNTTPSAASVNAAWGPWGVCRGAGSAEAGGVVSAGVAGAGCVVSDVPSVSVTTAIVTPPVRVAKVHEGLLCLCCAQDPALDRVEAAGREHGPWPVVEASDRRGRVRSG